MAARKKARKKVSKKKVGKKRRKRAAVVHHAAGELTLLQKIDKKVTRIDHTVNASHHLARKAKKAKRRSELEQAWEEREQSGYE